MRGSVLILLFLLLENTGLADTYLVFDPVVSERVEEGDVIFLVEAITKNLKRRGHTVLEKEERDALLSESGFNFFIVEEGMLEILKKSGIDYAVSETLSKSGSQCLLNINIWNIRKKKLEQSFSDWFECKIELLQEMNSVMESLFGPVPPQRPAVKDIEPAIQKRKSVGGAVALSLFLGFGAGNFYAGSPILGTIFLLGETACIFGGIFGAINASDWESFGMAFTSSSLFLGLRILDPITAGIVAARANRKVSSSYYFYPFFGRHGYGAGFTLRF